MVNTVLIMGRLTRDPELRSLPSGMKVVSFTLAVGRSFKDKDGQWKEEVSFIDTEAYGKLAEKVGGFKKGNQLLIQGELRQDRWESAEGEKKSKVKIVAEKITLIDKPTTSKPAAVKEEAEEEVVPF